MPRKLSGISRFTKARAEASQADVGPSVSVATTQATKMYRQVVYATLAVLVHSVLAGEHGLAHTELQIQLSRFQTIFVYSVIGPVPIGAAILLWTPLRRAGTYILGGSMVASLVFGIVYHFVLPGSDHVLNVAAIPGRGLFVATAALLVLTEGLTCWLGWRVLKELPPR